MIRQHRCNGFPFPERLAILAAAALTVAFCGFPVQAEKEGGEETSRDRASFHARSSGEKKEAKGEKRQEPTRQFAWLGERNPVGPQAPFPMETGQAAKPLWRAGGLWERPAGGTGQPASAPSILPSAMLRTGPGEKPQAPLEGWRGQPQRPFGWWAGGGNYRQDPPQEVGIPEGVRTPSWQREKPLQTAPVRWADRPDYPVYQPVLPKESSAEEKGAESGRLWALPVARTGRATETPAGQGAAWSRRQAKPAEMSKWEGNQVRALPVSRVGRSRPEIAPTPKAEIERNTGRWTERLRLRIREENRRVEGERRILPERSVIFRPDGTRVAPVVIHRHTHPVISVNFVNIRIRFGDPFFGYCFIPRPVSAFSIAYWRGFADGFFIGLHYGVPGHYHGRPIFLPFYFAYYFDDPFFVGFWYPGYYPGIYYYYGWLPRWCYPPSIIVYHADPYPIYLGRPAYYYLDRPRLDERGVERAVADLRRAWLEGDIDRLANYLREEEKISVYFEDEYSYSISGEDYYTMTLDALSTLKTVEMEFDDPIWINANEVFFTGRHVFYNPDKERQTVYVSYRLHRYGGRWYIIAVGSSPQPIKHSYRDFRYRN